MRRYGASPSLSPVSTSTPLIPHLTFAFPFSLLLVCSGSLGFGLLAVASIFFVPQGIVVRLALALGFILLAQEFLPDQQVCLSLDFRSSPRLSWPTLTLKRSVPVPQTCIISKKKIKVIRHDVSLASIAAPLERTYIYTTPGMLNLEIPCPALFFEVKASDIHQSLIFFPKKIPAAVVSVRVVDEILRYCATGHQVS